MQHGTVSSAERMSQGVIAWPQVRRIPLKQVKNRAKKEKSTKNRRLRRAGGPHLPPAWVPPRALASPQRRCEGRPPLPHHFVCVEKFTLPYLTLAAPSPGSETLDVGGWQVVVQRPEHEAAERDRQVAVIATPGVFDRATHKMGF